MPDPRDDMAPVFENWIDRQVRMAIERGEFDDLPGKGKPIDLGRPGQEKSWIQGRLEKEDLSSVLPAPLLLRKQKEELPEILKDAKTEDEAREIIEALNERIKEQNAAPTRPRIVTSLVNVEEALAQWRERSKGSN